FFFTDIEGSTNHAREFGPRWPEVLEEHHAILRTAIRDAGGVDVRTEGDAFFAVFRSQSDAVRAAVTAQRELAQHQWPEDRSVRVRMGMHTGEGRLAGDDYVGLDVHRAARIAAAGHGGQVLLSEATRALLGDSLADDVTLQDLGQHRLKDFDDPQPIYQLVIEGLPAEFPPLKTLEIPSNLPSQFTSFVGRERELRQVTDLLGRSRIVTLTGPGGSGKTRIAVEAAARLGDRFPGGTYFVDLSPITDPTAVPDAIASSLRLRRESGIPILEVVCDHLRDRRALLVMDNFEQVLRGAETVSGVLRAAPHVESLVTSRAPLGLAGEQEIPIPPFEVPHLNGDLEALRQNDAVMLFADRAVAVNPQFSLSDEVLPPVAEICSRLEGLPLAIELAASRVRLLPLHRMLEQLDHRLPVLVGGPRDAPERQRTLRGAIAWSYDLLDEHLQRFFRRLAVFAGGWTFDAADRVANPNAELGPTLELLDLLVQHSLVQPILDDPDGRFRMLETIREFGVERLEESDEAEPARRRHAERFLSLVEEAEPFLVGPEQRKWLDLIGREQDNLRAALAWTIGADQGEIAMRLGAAAWRFWYARAHLEEAHRWLASALNLPTSARRTRHRARCLTGLGGITYWEGDFETSDACYEEALSIYRDAGDPAPVVEATFNLSCTKAVKGDVTAAMGLIQESLETARRLGDKRGEAWAIWIQAASLMFAGDVEAARALNRESVRLFEEIGDDTWGLGNAYAGQAGLSAMSGDPEEARRQILLAIDIWEDQGNALVTASQLNFLGIAAIGAGHYERAVKLSAFARAIKDKVGGNVPDAFFPFRDPKDSGSDVLDDETIDRLWAEGQRMTLEEAIAYAREDW
ncbi:MAG TPA: adenylate/guanylate cyclase domain-containing protein, partial [Actinomycetota bacterium]